MKKKISVGVSLVLVLLAVILTFEVTYTVLSVQHRKEMNDAYAHLENYNKLLYVDELYRSLYVKDVDEEALTDGILAGYVMGTGDRYGAYYPAEEFQTYMDSLNGDMQGIGVNVIYNSDYGAIEIINVMPDSPALEAGVEPGDLIVYVGEEMESVAELGYYGALAKLQGKAGTTAVFTVARGKNYEESHSFSILRGYVTEQTVLYHVYAPDSTVGVVKITSFDRATPEQFYAAIDDLMFYSGDSSGAEICPGLNMGMTYRQAAKALDLSELSFAPEQRWTDPVYLCYGSAAGCALELYFVGSSEDSAILVSVNATPIG